VSVRLAIMTAILIFQAVAVFVTYRADRKNTFLRQEIAKMEEKLQAATAEIIHAAGAPEASGVFIIHTKQGEGPVGWKCAAEMFTEEDGSKQPGCYFMVNLKPGEMETHVDYLLGGESCISPVVVEPSRPSSSDRGSTRS
jgi:hypothetical protein